MREHQDTGDAMGLWPTDGAPVVCIVYNRVRLVRQLIDKLRQVKPRVVLVVADGPKPGNAADAAACAQVRAEVGRIDWDCTLHFEYAQSNMGCSERIVSGLNWAFTLVDRAIILEDDIDADPRFFHWASRMLLAYEDRDDVAMLCGHNPLVWWPSVAASTAAIPSRRGGVYGWATWRNQWRSVQSFSIDDVAGPTFEPALGALLNFYLEQAKREHSLMWDVNWTLRMATSGRSAMVSPVNLVHNLGLGPDATLTKEGDDMLFFLPRATVPDADTLDALLFPAALSLVPKGSDDREYDRAKVLLELMVRTRDPGMALRLARRDDFPLPNDLRLHLLPFRHRDETCRWIEHLAHAGVDRLAIERWRHALGCASFSEPTGVNA